jgi:MFS family permease
MAEALGTYSEPAERVGNRWVVFIALANLGLFMAYFGTLGVLLPNQVPAIAGPAHKITVFGWVTGVGAVFAMISNPLAGALSDRTTGRLGRRHPWTFCGALASAAALALLAGQRTIAGITIAWCLAQVGLNAMQAGIAAGVPDRVPVSQRGSVSGWMGTPQVVGVLLAVVLVTQVVSGNGGYVLLATATATVALALPFVLLTRDAPLSRADRPVFGWREFLRSFWLSPARYPDFGWVWLTRFLMVLGNSMAVLYLLYFLRDQIRYSQIFPGQNAEDGLAILLFIYTGAVVLTAVLGGMISDRSGRRRRLVVVSGLVMAVPAIMLALWPTWPVTVAAAVILGLGFGVYLAVDQALITQVLPAAAGRAKDLGVISVASSGGQVLAPAIAAPLVTYLGGYPALYLSVAIIVILGSLCVSRVRSVPLFAVDCGAAAGIVGQLPSPPTGRANSIPACRDAV